MDSRDICLCTGLPSSKFVSHHEVRIKPRHMILKPGSHMFDGRYPFDPLQIVYNTVYFITHSMVSMCFFKHV